MLKSVDDCVKQIKDVILAESEKLFLWPRFNCLEYDDKRMEWRNVRMQGVIVSHGNDKVFVVLKEGLFAMNIAQLPLWNSRRELPINYFTHGSLALWRVSQTADYVNKGYVQLFEETRNSVRKY